MKRILLLVYFILVSISVFSQNKSIYDMTPEEYYANFYGVPIKDYTLDNSVVFYAYPNTNSIMVYTKETGKKEMYKYGELPNKYYCFVDKNGNYSHPKFVICLCNGKYGVIDKKGNVVEDFKWDMSKYVIYNSDEHFSVYDKNGNSIYEKDVNISWF